MTTALTALRRLVSDAVPPSTRARVIELEFRATGILGRMGFGRLFRAAALRRLEQRPDEIDIEVTSLCDADCIMCPRRSMSRKPGHMDFDLFRRIVDQAIALHVPKLVLNGYGEFSLLRNSSEYLKYIRSKSRRVKLMINSNGMRMNESICRSFIEHRVDVVNVTIDGATAETFEAIRRHLKLNIVESNVKMLLRLRDEARKRHPYVGIFMIAMPQNIHEAGAFEAKWKDVGDYVGFTGLNPRVGSVTIPTKSVKHWESIPCYQLWSQMPILSDGSVALCCDDWDARGGMGNVAESSVADVWRNQQRKRMQAIHRSKSSASIPLCQACQQPRKGPWWFSE